MKKGISLIVLVITIIVMIIIAGAIIISLNSTNILAKSNEAVVKTDVQTINTKLTLAYTDLRVDNPTIDKYDATTTFKVADKSYTGIQSYYDEVVPEVSSTDTSKNVIPTGYELVIGTNGAATVVAK